MPNFLYPRIPPYPIIYPLNTMTERKKVIKKLDTAHSKLIRAIEKYCVICGTTERLQCGHLHTRAAYSTRWDILPDGNCHTQCAKCNMRHEYDSYPFNNWYITNFGKDAWDELYRRHKKTRKYTTFEIEELTKEYEQKLRMVQESN